MKFIQAIDAERQSYQPECWPSKSVTTSQTMQHVVSTFQKHIIDVGAARPVNKPRVGWWTRPRVTENRGVSSIKLRTLKLTLELFLYTPINLRDCPPQREAFLMIDCSITQLLSSDKYLQAAQAVPWLEPKTCLVVCCTPKRLDDRVTLRTIHLLYTVRQIQRCHLPVVAEE